jgi:hypothetical protein
MLEQLLLLEELEHREAFEQPLIEVRACLPHIHFLQKVYQQYQNMNYPYTD